MSAIKFEDELVVNLCVCKSPSIYNEQAKEEHCQEIPGVYLEQVARVISNGRIGVPNLFDAIDETLDSEHKSGSR